MKTLIPYILAYLIVATCTAVYPQIYRHFVSHAPVMLPHSSVSVVLNPGMTQAELDAKLQQVGLSEAQPHIITTVRPAPLLSLVVHYVFDAVVFSAFVGLVILFRRAFQADVPNHEHAA
jgi:hypothetical protein